MRIETIYCDKCKEILTEDPANDTEEVAFLHLLNDISDDEENEGEEVVTEYTLCWSCMGEVKSFINK